MTRWGVVCTTNADTTRILDFAAWHLELGADRIHVWLDAPDPEAEHILAAHPKLRVRVTDAASWRRRGGRPARHQVRQIRNATRVYRSGPEVDWLAHVDVDEFILPAQPVHAVLGALDDAVSCARIRPVEALAQGAGDTPGLRSFKAFHIDQSARRAATHACFPRWADHLSGGFLSHVAGKLFVRTGLSDVEFRIHNALVGDLMNPGVVELSGLELAHLHADSWARFHGAYPFRLARGSYRPELKPQGRGPDAKSLHGLFRAIEASGGETALRDFFEEVATATPRLVAALEAEGLLRRRAFNPSALHAKHFPAVRPGPAPHGVHRSR